MIGEYIGNYRLTRLLGEGGMGMVYQAVHDGVGGQAAIKVLRPEVAQKKDATTRLFNEARAANSIPHPGIVRIFDCGYTSQGIAYLAMEYLEGESLRTRIDRERSLAIADALRIARQIASVLQAAHSRQVVHRDLKPDNIMLVPDPELPGGERVKLLDFGVAKLAETLNAEPMLTRSDMLMGTPTYMAPEQCRGAKHVTDRSDVYSLGVILYQMIAGLPPFTGETVGELIAMHLTESEPQLTELIPGIEPAIATLVHSMLRKKPAERPSVDEVAQSLKRLLMDISQAEGMSPGQARRMASETAIAIPPPLSAQAQALLRGNTAPPTLGGSDSGQHARLPEAAKNSARSPAAVAAAVAAPAAATSASATPDTAAPTRPLDARYRSSDPAFSSTWDGEAVSRHVPAQLLAAAAETAPVRAVPQPGRPATAAIDPEATPPISTLPPPALSSATTPRHDAVAATSTATPPAERTARTVPTPIISPRRPWRLVGGLLLASSALLFLYLRLQNGPPSTDPNAGKPLVPGLVRTTQLPTTPPTVGDAANPGPTQTALQPPSVPPAVAHDPRPLPSQADAGASATHVAMEPAKVADPPATGSKPTPVRTDPPDSPAGDTKLDGKRAPLAPDPAQGAALVALRNKQFAEALRLSQSCVDKQPQNHRCWWMLGVAACQSGDAPRGTAAQTRLTGLGKGALAREISQACANRTGGTASEVPFSLRLNDEKSEWLNHASRLFEQGRHLQAQQLAEKNLAQDPVEAWSMIGRSACALGDEDKANMSLSKVGDKTAKSDIVHYCLGRGFAYSLGSGSLSKRK